MKTYLELQTDNKPRLGQKGGIFYNLLRTSSITILWLVKSRVFFFF